MQKLNLEITIKENGTYEVDYSGAFKAHEYDLTSYDLMANLAIALKTLEQRSKLTGNEEEEPVNLMLDYVAANHKDFYRFMNDRIENGTCDFKSASDAINLVRKIHYGKTRSVKQELESDDGNFAVFRFKNVSHNVQSFIDARNRTSLERFRIALTDYYNCYGNHSMNEELEDDTKLALLHKIYKAIRNKSRDNDEALRYLVQMVDDITSYYPELTNC